jgi:hypothetical protein
VPLSQNSARSRKKLDPASRGVLTRCQVRYVLMPCRHPGADRLIVASNDMSSRSLRSLQDD